MSFPVALFINTRNKIKIGDLFEKVFFCGLVGKRASGSRVYRRPCTFGGGI